MEKLICANVFVPLRMSPSHKSEQGSQILFGEKYTILDRTLNWIKIKNLFDNYEGWIDGDHHLYFNSGKDDGQSVVLAERTEFADGHGSTIILEPGSEIYGLKAEENYFIAGEKKFTARSKIITSKPGETITGTAKKFLNCPYLWGGRISGGMDCSGLTQLVYKLHGHSLPRDSFNQAETGKTVGFLEEAAAGDLLFFDNERGNVTHVGILLDNNHVIHCSGKVRTDRIDHQGIYIEKTGKYTHSLRTIKRYDTGI